MSSSTSPLLQTKLMHSLKPRASIEESAPSKAATWAWYQRGSGSDGRPMKYNLERTLRSPRPSRYRLEAIREAQAAIHNESRPPSALLPPTQAEDSSDLLDEYEIERISRQLDHYIEASSTEYYGGWREDCRRVSSPPGSEGSKKKYGKRNKGLSWLSHRVTCGSRNDVVELGGGGGRLPEKGVAVVGEGSCRARAAHAKSIN
ncbi:uncharacterized protein LOC127804316 [Diospyros lotus]|uniref:uncharacterized protein LOC127804316 n=1 Tax=Diospyros lotus TaxID=55363 RepID=UPI00224D0773|nr:uncharacterized protein LOC127804316 [Diospyros lotus]